VAVGDGGVWANGDAGVTATLLPRGDIKRRDVSERIR